MLVFKVSFLEEVRGKIPWIYIFVLVVCFSLSLLVSTLSYGVPHRTLLIWGTSLIKITSLVMSLYYSYKLFYEDGQNRKVFFYLTKPISRWSYYLQKYFAYLLVISLMIFIGSVSFSLFLYLTDIPTPMGLALIFGLSFFEILVFFSWSQLFYGLISPVMALLSCILMYGSIYAYQSLDHLTYRLPSISNMALQIVAHVIPQFYYFNFQENIFTAEAIPNNYLLTLIAYGACWIMLSILLSYRVFKKRDF